MLWNISTKSYSRLNWHHFCSRLGNEWMNVTAKAVPLGDILNDKWAFLLKIGELINITSKAVPLGNILRDKWVKGEIIFFFYVLQQLLMFLVSTMLVNEIHVVFNTLFHQYPFSILWQEFLVVSDIALFC